MFADTSGAITRTITAYDARNEVTRTTQPQGSGVNQPSFQIDRRQTWNAFGELKSQTDGMGNVTNFAYNTMGKLITETHPSVMWIDEHGNNFQSAPIDTYYYDASGRQIGHRDANGNLTTSSLLAGTGYDGNPAKVVTEFHPDGGKITSRYDAFGDALTSTSASGVITNMTYDGVGNLISVVHASHSENGYTEQRTDSYAYDGLRQRISHTVTTQDATAVSATETTQYDVEGRIVQTTDLAAHATTYAYAWYGANQLATDGLGAFGGWGTTTTNVAGKTSIDYRDAFGNMASRVDVSGAPSSQDFGGRVYHFSYNLAGQLVHQTNNDTTYGVGQSLDYTYYSNGFVATVIDNSLHIQASYNYDNDGNRIHEKDVSIGASPTTYEDETITYDAMNRVVEVYDPGPTNDDPGVDIKYSYDKVGNRRNVRTLAPSGNSDFWYKYDSMNRFVLTMGTLSGGNIITGSTGTTITYDVNGNRATATYGYDGHTEVYGYNSANDLVSTSVGSVTIAQRKVDALGRMFYLAQYNASGTFVSSRQNIVYDLANNVLSETDYGTGGAYTDVTNDYKAWNGSAYAGAYQGLLVHSTAVAHAGSTATTTNTNYFYVWWDQAKQSEIQANTPNPTAPQTGYWASGYCGFSYDMNGHLNGMYDRVSNRTLLYNNSATGEVMQRQEVDQGTNGELQRNWYFNGHRIGNTSTAPSQNPAQTDYAQQLALQSASLSGKGHFSFPLAMADFDQSYDPINSGNPGAASFTYTVQSSGETLRSIASALWGDADLWYLIAEANGLQAGSTLVAHQTLTIPNKVANAHNNGSTYRPYNPMQDVGDMLFAPQASPLVGRAQDQFNWVALGLANIDDGSADPILADHVSRYASYSQLQSQVYLYDPPPYDDEPNYSYYYTMTGDPATDALAGPVYVGEAGAAQPTASNSVTRAVDAAGQQSGNTDPDLAAVLALGGSPSMTLEYAKLAYSMGWFNYSEDQLYNISIMAYASTWTVDYGTVDAADDWSETLTREAQRYVSEHPYTYSYLTQKNVLQQGPVVDANKPQITIDTTDLGIPSFTYTANDGTTVTGGTDSSSITSYSSNFGSSSVDLTNNATQVMNNLNAGGYLSTAPASADSSSATYTPSTGAPANNSGNDGPTNWGGDGPATYTLVPNSVTTANGNTYVSVTDGANQVQIGLGQAVAGSTIGLTSTGAYTTTAEGVSGPAMSYDAYVASEYGNSAPSVGLQPTTPNAGEGVQINTPSPLSAGFNWVVSNGGTGNYTPTSHYGDLGLQGTFVPLVGTTVEGGFYANSNGFGGSAGDGTYQSVTLKFGFGVGLGPTAAMGSGAFGQDSNWNVNLSIGPFGYSAPLSNIFGGNLSFQKGASIDGFDFEATIGKTYTVLHPH